MTFKRTLSFIIDFIVILIVLNIINSFFQQSNYIIELKAEQNQILEEYTSHEIGFDRYFVKYSTVTHNLAKEQIEVNIIYTCFMFIYFILLPYFWKGRTIGTYINKI